MNSENNEAVKIIPYEKEHQPDFKRLNEAWLKQFGLEAVDIAVLTQPEKYILDKGGYIFMAILGERIVGTVALVPEGEGIMEMTKLAVDENFRGKGYGEMLVRYLTEHAPELGIYKMILYSQTALAPAIALYRKTGFTEIPVTPETKKYARCNIKMEMEF